jgi:HEAT repeat protein
MVALENECNDIINNTLLKINSIYDEQINWGEAELKNALNIVKLQSSVNPGITSEQVSKSIKSSMKLISRIKPELDGSLDILAELLTDPWIIIASNFKNPADDIYHSAWALTKPENQNASEEVFKDHLLRLLHHINNQIKHKDTGLVIVFDHFENLLNTEYKNREKLKKLLNALLDNLNQNFELHLMMLLSCSTSQQSVILGGDLYTNFSNKLLVGPMESVCSLKLAKDTLEHLKINATEEVAEYFVNYASGVPLWLFNSIQYANYAAKSINLKTIDTPFLSQFLPASSEDILDSMYSLMCSTFASNITLLQNVIKALGVSKEPINVFQIAKQTNISESDSQFILEELSKAGFLIPSAGEGYYFKHKLIKKFFVHECKSRDYYNAKLLNLLKLLNIVQQELLNKTNPANTINYLKELCEQYNNPKVLEKLLILLEHTSKHSDPEVRIATTSGLKEYNTLSSMHILLKNVNDPIPEVRLEILNCIESCLLTVNPEEKDLQAVVTGLKTLMFDKIINIRIKAVNVLGKIKTKTSNESLISLLRDKNEDIRALALKNLGKHYKEENYYIYLETITDQSSKVRAIAAEQLGKFRTRQSIQILCTGLEDPDKLVRKACAKSLGQLQYPETALSLINALEDPDEDVRINVIKSLGKLRNKRAVPYLTDLIQNQSNDVIQWVATRALGDIPCKESREFLDKLKGEGNSIIQKTAQFSLQRVTGSLN